MFAFLFTLLIVWIIMWGFFKFMYPKPPKAFMPKQGDVITPRDCDFCGHPLAEYRGVLEQKPESALTPAQRDNIKQIEERQVYLEGKSTAEGDKTSFEKMSRQQKKALKQVESTRQQELRQQQLDMKKMTTWFFCNYDHQANFHEKQKDTTTSI